MIPEIRPQWPVSCDVLVAGAGIAGIMAALAAARAGRSVVLASAGDTLSGSSFYPGTWGLGLIGPADQADRADLADTILSVGCGMADPALVERFVAGITPAIQGIRDLGVELKTARDGDGRDFIPCFDHKHRAWNGLLFPSMRQVLPRRLEELGVRTLPGAALLSLHRHEGRVCGAALYSPRRGLISVSAGAVVLATGGCGGLFAHRLTTGDVISTGHSLAVEQGASLINLEFMQMMPGYVTPCPGTIFNERTFRYAILRGPDGRDRLADRPDRAALLDQRSAHGPFTSRLDSRAVDMALAEGGLEGTLVEYDPSLEADMPEFIRTYFDWLAREKGLTPRDPIRIALFAHASNGGVYIHGPGETGVPGLYACGEVTGGMHGADRIGGLSTANGLVFGGQAGAAAAEFAAGCGGGEAPGLALWTIPDAARVQRDLRALMSSRAMVIRRGPQLEEAAAQVEAWLALPRQGTEDLAAAALSRQVYAQLELSLWMLQAQLLRRESRGSHYRADFPREEAALARPILVTNHQGEVRVAPGAPFANTL